MSDKISAFERIVHTYYDEIYKFAYRKTGIQSDAEDIAQEVFLKFFSNVDCYHECGKMKNYLFRLAINAIHDSFRKKQREPVLDIDSMELPDLSPLPLEKMLQKEKMEYARNLLRSLPDYQADVIILRFYHNLSFREIARITDTNISTVKSRYRQGIGKMKSAMEGRANE